jgi:NIMA (never in mitosis gene a)-related kinase
MSLNDFVILQRIGEGSYSSVHKVKRISDGNIYALKQVYKLFMKGKNSCIERQIKIECTE